MPTLSVTLQLNYGDSVPVGLNVPQRATHTYTLDCAEEARKIVAVPASSTDYPVALDSVTAPKFLFVKTLDVDVTVNLVSGADTVTTALSAESGWLMLATPNGQAINALTITTPASPPGGAHVQVLAFE